MHHCCGPSTHEESHSDGQSLQEESIAVEQAITGDEQCSGEKCDGKINLAAMHANEDRI